MGIDLLKLYPSGRFPEMPYAESMRLYGNDKPDLRFDMKHVDLTDLLIESHAGKQVSVVSKPAALRLRTVSRALSLTERLKGLR